MTTNQPLVLSIEEAISVEKVRIYSDVYEREIDSVQVTSACDECGGTSHLSFRIAIDPVEKKVSHSDYWACEKCRFTRDTLRSEDLYIRKQEHTLCHSEEDA